MDTNGMKLIKDGITSMILELRLRLDANVLLINIIKSLNQIPKLSLKNLNLNKRFVS